MNHHNGNTNVRHKEDPYSGNTDEKGYEIVISKPVGKDGELFLSYNQCTICHEYYDWFGTPEVSAHALQFLWQPNCLLTSTFLFL